MALRVQSANISFLECSFDLTTPLGAKFQVETYQNLIPMRSDTFIQGTYI